MGDDREPFVDERQQHVDLGFSIKLQGDPEDRAPMKAALDGDYVVLRSMLLAPPYRVDEAIADRIVNELRTGHALP